MKGLYYFFCILATGALIKALSIVYKVHQMRLNGLSTGGFEGQLFKDGITWFVVVFVLCLVAGFFYNSSKPILEDLGTDDVHVNIDL